MIIFFQLLSFVSMASDIVEETDSGLPKVELGFQYGGGYLIGSKMPYVSSKAPGFFFIGFRKGKWSFRSSLPGFLLDYPRESGSISVTGRLFTFANGVVFTSSMGMDAGVLTRGEKDEAKYTSLRFNAYVGFERDLSGNFFSAMELGVGIQGHELHPTSGLMVAPLINGMAGYKF